MIAIAMPTYMRPDLLPRTVASLLAQEMTDWICYISDDEEGGGDTWEYLAEISAKDPRIIPLKNSGQHGQVGNTNAALLAAAESGAEWIKLLHDDDELTPDCLAVFWAAAQAAPGAAVISCKVEQYYNNKLVRPYTRKVKHEFQLVPQKYMHLGMYLQDDVGGGIPSQVMVSSRVVHAGELFTEPEGIRFAVDALYVAQAARHGDSVVIHRALVRQHQGHETETSRLTEEILDAEYVRLRELQLEDIDPELNPPSLATVTAYLALLRAMNRAKRRRFGQALRLLLSGLPYPKAWLLAARWLFRQFKPESFYEVPHNPLQVRL